MVDDLLSRCADIANISVHRSGRVISQDGALLLRENMQLLQDEISHSSAHSSALVDYLALHKALLSPVRQLYPDILSHIFLLATPEDWDWHLCGTVIHSCTQVCHVWRAVAVGTPSLWSTIHIRVTEPLPDIDYPDDVSSSSANSGSEGQPGDDEEGSQSRDQQAVPERPLAQNEHTSAPQTAPEAAAEQGDDAWAWATGTYLERSSQLPLTVIYHAAKAYATGKPFDEAGWLLLIQEKERWKSADLEVPIEMFDLLGPSLSLPLLEDLQLSVYSKAQGLYAPVKFFWDLPRIRQITIDNCALPEKPDAELPPSWSPRVLRVINTNSTSRADITGTSRLPRHCRASVDTLSVWSLYSSDPDVPPEPMTDFPALLGLEVIDYGAEICRIIRSAPGVDLLRIQATTGEESDEHIEEVKTMLSRASFPHLESIVFIDIQAEADEIVECLQAVPTLKELTIEETDVFFERYHIAWGTVFSVELMEAMTRSPDKPESMSFLPNLTYFEVHSVENSSTGMEDEMWSTCSIYALRKLSIKYVRKHKMNITPLLASNGSRMGRDWGRYGM
ncbi:hypothetical protein K525DRAFT_265402 [Schizophyllum commune Loenen D]|nr:hypothetical protein K525DRAFT_265402 [Schizophyllum commune Loenen D]